MTSYPFAFKTRYHLEAAGFHPKRRAFTLCFKRTLERAQNPVHPCVMDFLRRFGGLTLTFAHVTRVNEDDVLHLDPSRAAKRFDITPQALAKYNRWSARSLCAIGTAQGDQLLLLMAEDGSVFGARDDLLLRLGDSAEEAIDALCTQESFEQVHPRESVYRLDNERVKPKEYPFSKRTLKVLAKAGWRPGRKVPTKLWEEMLAKANYPVHPVVVEFLQEFGGIFRTSFFTWDGFWIDPTRSLELFGEREEPDEYEAVTGQRFCSIGTAQSDADGEDTELMMAEDGSVFGLTHWIGQCWRLGRSGEEALEALCTGAWGASIEVPDQPPPPPH